MRQRFSLHCRGSPSTLLSAVRHQAFAAAAAAATTNQVDFHPQEGGHPRELTFHDTFASAAIDLHYLLLLEAHKKHGVYLNVPPQLPPTGTPPAVPDVIFSEAQSLRLRGLKLSYEPTHGPPPLATTGTRGLAEMLAEEDAASKRKASAPTTTSSTISPATSSSSTTDGGETAASTTQSLKQSATTEEVKRRPVDPNNRFHCSVCAKSFRIRLSAEHHLRELHGSEGRVEDGAGPGELIVEEAAPLNQTTGVTASSTPVVVAAASGPAVPTIADIKKLIAAPIPTENEIDALLIAMWDPIGRTRSTSTSTSATSAAGGGTFVPMSDVVAGVADNRKPLSELNLAPIARATPEGAAPGIKRVAPSSSASQATKFTSIKDSSARFPNPFGESEEAKLLAQMKDEPLNPFLPLEAPAVDPTTGLVPGTPSLAVAAQQRPYRCPMCSTSFRLMDALAHHLETVHEVEMAPEEIIATQDKQVIGRNPFVVPKASTSGEASSSTGGAGGDSSSADDGGDNSALNNGLIPPEPPLEVDVSVHIRAMSNALFLGEVVDVQAGYSNASKIVQYVVKMTTTTTRSTATKTAAAVADGDGSSSSTAVTNEVAPSDIPAQAEGAVSQEEDEFVVVRAHVDGLKFTTDSIRTGMWVLVHGVLKMNRHTDDASRRLHAYPFVQVCAPLGNISIVEGG